jgi:hypothetical protein
MDEGVNSIHLRAAGEAIAMENALAFSALHSEMFLGWKKAT